MLPASLGPFAVYGILYETADGLLLRGDDPGLQRTVWLWLRAGNAPALSTARRELGRATRLRWLAGGDEGEQQWDAFLAPAGCLLADVLRQDGAQDWHFVQQWLQKLADELKAACADGTLPMPLSADHVWVRPDGGLMLLDFALTDSPALPPAADAEDVTGDDAACTEGALVRADGRPAPRWRCAWRALLFWLLPVTLLVAAPAVDVTFWSMHRAPDAVWLAWASAALWWGLPILLAIYLALALWNPSRALHDRLAGTNLVPR